MIRAIVRLSVVLLFIAAVPADAAAAAPTVKVEIDGRCIEQLRMLDRGGREWNLTRPGPTLNLFEGEYLVLEVVLQGGYSTKLVDSGPEGWLAVRRGEPCRLVAGAPLKPSVKVQRQGTVLQLDYQLLDAEGRNYTSAATNNPPQVTIFRDGEVIHSGSFEYG